jgi:hypothetical protein
MAKKHAQSNKGWFTYVMSESSDWFVIPADKAAHWHNEGRFGDDDGEYPDYAIYCPNVLFQQWKRGKC